MSSRCKVCNATNPNADQKNSDTNWMCQNCGNLLDVNGYIVASE